MPLAPEPPRRQCGNQGLLSIVIFLSTAECIRSNSSLSVSGSMIFCTRPTKCLLAAVSSSAHSSVLRARPKDIIRLVARIRLVKCEARRPSSERERYLKCRNGTAPSPHDPPLVGLPPPGGGVGRALDAAALAPCPKAGIASLGLPLCPLADRFSSEHARGREPLRGVRPVTGAVPAGGHALAQAPPPAISGANSTRLRKRAA